MCCEMVVGVVHLPAKRCSRFLDGLVGAPIADARTSTRNVELRVVLECGLRRLHPCDRHLQRCFQIIRLLSPAWKIHHLRQTAVEHILVPCVVKVAVPDRIELRKRQRMNTYLIAAAAKFSRDVAGKKLRAPPVSETSILLMRRAVQDFLELGHELHFVEQQIIPSKSPRMASLMLREARLGVAQLPVLDAQRAISIIWSAERRHKQIRLENGEQQIGFSAAPYAGDVTRSCRCPCARSAGSDMPRRISGRNHS